MGRTNIEWCSDTLNPVRGCFPISPGCEKCYAMRLAATRLRHHPKYEGLATYDGRPRWTGEVQLDIDVMREVLTWKKPRTCFLCDMSDLFYEKVPDTVIMAVLGFCAAAPDHRFYILTKRADRMRQWFADLQTDDDGPGHDHLGHRLLAVVGEAAAALAVDEDDHERAYDLLAERVPSNTWPLPNVWLGVSAEDQERVDERVGQLRECPAAARFVSYEPALGPVDLSKHMWPVHSTWPAKYKSPEEAVAAGAVVTRHRQGLVSTYANFIDWVIVGAESGPGARAVETKWARSVRDQCADADVAFYLKQWTEGEGIAWPTTDRGTLVSLPLLDGVQHAAFPVRTP